MQNLDDFRCVGCEEVLLVDEDSRQPIGMSCGHNLCQGCGNLFLSRGEDTVNLCCNGADSQIARHIDGRLVLNPRNLTLMEVVRYAGRVFPRDLLAPIDCPICFHSMKSSGLRVPVKLPCEHTICRTCHDDIVKQNRPQAPNCPFCRTEIIPGLPDNKVLREILRRYERVYPECQVHPGQFMFFVCQKQGCDSALLCFQCTSDGPHNGHAHVHSMQEAQDLRQQIRDTSVEWQKLATRYEQDEDVFLDIARTFQPNHADYLNLLDSIDKHYSRTLRANQPIDFDERKKAELRLVSEKCVNTIREMREKSARRRDLINEAAVNSRRVLELLDRSDADMIRNQVQVRSSMGNPQSSIMHLPGDFEYERLGTYYIKRGGNQPELKRYFDVEISVDNEEAENVWGAFIGWLGTVGRRRGYNPRMDGDEVFFDFEDDLMRLKVIRPIAFDPHHAQFPCRFTNVYWERTMFVFFRENEIYIDERSFANMNEASAVLLDAIHGLRLLFD